MPHRAGKGLYWRWLLHAAVLGVAALSVLMPWGAGATRSVEGALLPMDESAWLPAVRATPGDAAKLSPVRGPQTLSGLTSGTPAPVVPFGTPDMAAPRSTAAPLPTPTATPTRTRPPAPQSYRVQVGDSVTLIAQSFGVSRDTILQANALANPDSLYVGQTLTILPVSGLIHEVMPGESLSGIAALYGVAMDAIAEYNDLTSVSVLQTGQGLLVPGGRAPTPQPTATPAPSPTATRVPPTAVPTALATRVPPTATTAPASAQTAARSATAVRPAPGPAGAAPPPPAAGPANVPKGGGQLAWPVAGFVSQQFGERGHQGLDIGAPMGAPVRAAADGRVVNLERRTSGYGWFLVIDHGNGLKSLYAHLSGFNVKLGDAVTRGQQIGTVGSTGLSTGPHLHFEVTSNGTLVNPLSYL